MAVNLKGIDVSTWQGVINWPQVKAAGIQFAIVRAGHDRSRRRGGQVPHRPQGEGARVPGLL